MTQTETVLDGINVEFSGDAAGVVGEISALMANAAETYGMVMVLRSTDGQTREDAEGVLMQAMVEGAWLRLQKKRQERGNNG